MLELYHNDMWTCAQKVRLALAEKEAVWHSHHLDLRARDQQKPEYINLNPNAVVPTLKHDGAIIIELQILASYACYYNDSRTHLSLHKDTPLGRAVQRYGNIAATPVLSGLYHRYARI